nr:site-specific integrase [Amycolatopsis rubida]
MRVVKVREAGGVRQVRLLDAEGRAVEVAGRFPEHLVDRGFSPNTLCAYGYDLKHLFVFLQREQLAWQEFGPADTLRFLGYLRRLPSKRAAQRLGLTVVVGGAAMPGTLLSPATVNRVLAAHRHHPQVPAHRRHPARRGRRPHPDDHGHPRAPQRADVGQVLPHQ